MSGMDENPEQEAEPEKTQERESKQRLEQLPQEKKLSKKDGLILALKVLFLLSPFVIYLIGMCKEMGGSLWEMFFSRSSWYLTTAPLIVGMLLAALYFVVALRLKKGGAIVFLIFLCIVNLCAIVALSMITIIVIAFGGDTIMYVSYLISMLLSLAIIIYFSIETGKKIRKSGVKL
jgi:hypothetical protein